MDAYYWQDEDLQLRLKVAPSASQDSLAIEEDHLKVRIKAPPTDGKANKYLKKYLGKLFKVPQSRVSIERGANSRLKLVKIHNPVRLPDFMIDTRQPRTPGQK